MEGDMRAVGNFLREPSLRMLARPSDYALGAEMAAKGGVDILDKRRNHILAIAGGNSSGERRRVTLRTDDDGLRWNCTCTGNADHFCQHCVATAIAARKVRAS
jgi:uncharacterized Zn finger protein